MLEGIKKKLKKIIAITLCVASVSATLYMAIPVANSATSILGTNAALGSPILNSSATIDNWNKWEMVCWGVFLSNWCQPLVDSYETAFTVGAKVSTPSGTSSGSNGNGYKALCFGSGSDTNNNKVIKDFCGYALKVEKSTSPKQIYVGYTELNNFKVKKTADPNDENSGAKLREAKFNDLFFKDEVDTSASKKKTSIELSIESVNGYNDMVKAKKGYLPTFYIKNKNNKYVKILDFTNSWDLQAFSAMINAITKTKTGKGIAKKFSKNFEGYSHDNPELGFDCFGNIIIGSTRVMVMPASNNQNLTKTRTINILNSWIMNNMVSTYSPNKLVSELRQTDDGTGFAAAFRGSSIDTKYSGLPAFGKETLTSSGYLYFDTDSIVSKQGSFTVNNSLTELFDCDINSAKNKYPLEFEISGLGYKNKFSFFGSEESLLGTDGNSIKTTVYTASILANSLSLDAQKPEILHQLVNTDGTKVSVFSESPVAIPVQAINKSNDKNVKQGDALRHYINWLYRTYKGKTSADFAGSKNTLTAEKMKSYLADCKSMSDLRSLTNDTLKDYFDAAYPDYKDNSFDNWWNTAFDTSHNETLSEGCARICLVYPTSSVMKAVSQVLSVAEGTEFNTYCTMLYMTYLDWYGVTNKTTLDSFSESQSNFSEEIFDTSSDVLNVDPSDITDMMSKEDMEDEVLNLSYLMLSEEKGRSYRKNLTYNGLADFIYEQYNRMVYGGKSSSYSGSSTKTSSGFLAVSTFSDNPLTSWFLQSYADIAIVLIMICFIIMLVIGILRRRKLSWFIVSTAIIVNVVLLIPCTGEITPAVTTKVTQQIFGSKMNYWALSEGVANAKLEADASNTEGDLKGLSKEEAATVLSLVNQMKVVHTDRSLMVKQDVSQKITQNLGGIYADIQSIKSARWLLPMVMRQFSAEKEESAEYVYTRLSDLYDDASNIYWYYKPTDALSVTKPTLTSSQFSGDGCKAATAESEVTGNGGRNQYGSSQGSCALKGFYVDYKEPKWSDDTSTKINYTNYSYSLTDNNNDLVHLYFYILHDQNLGMNSSNLSRTNVFGNKLNRYDNADSWEKFVVKAKSSLSLNNWKTSKDSYYGYERICDKYDRTDCETLKDGYGYFKSTETPYYYFFSVIKDSFPTEKTLGALITRLQGTVEKDAEGKDVRNTFMHATETANKEEENVTGTGLSNSDVSYTGYVRDVVDLQEMFSNMIPYMYEMTLASGGFDGESGVLGSEEITEDCKVYKGNKMSWAYRCNWATKIMENPNYSKEETIGLKDGSKVKVKYPLLPESYKAAGRDMVFSEAQQKALGLKDSQLSTVELKCIKINKEISREWTMLINYSATENLTKEVMFRLMATTATNKFCSEFSNSGVLDNRYTIYPQSIDLRYLSFDAVMKLLMLNVSHNTSYAYGNSMETLLNDTDIVTAILLLILTALAVWVVWLLQCIIMGAVFYLGFIAIIRSLFSGPEYKGKVAAAQLIQNLVFMIYTLLYYYIISVLIKFTSSDEVLSTSKIEVKTGSPLIVILVMIILTSVYIAAMYIQVTFCFKHYRDMGFEVMAFMSDNVVGRLQGGLTSVKDGIGKFFGADGGIGSRSRGSGKLSGTGKGAAINNDGDEVVKVENTGDSSGGGAGTSGATVTTSSNSSNSNNKKDIADDVSIYTDGEIRNDSGNITSDDIDKGIDKGHREQADKKEGHEREDKQEKHDTSDAYANSKFGE